MNEFNPKWLVLLTEGQSLCDDEICRLEVFDYSYIIGLEAY